MALNLIANIRRKKNYLRVIRYSKQIKQKPTLWQHDMDEFFEDYCYFVSITAFLFSSSLVRLLLLLLLLLGYS